jgi:hypothetical protein
MIVIYKIGEDTKMKKKKLKIIVDSLNSHIDLLNSELSETKELYKKAIADSKYDLNLVYEVNKLLDIANARIEELESKAEG